VQCVIDGCSILVVPIKAIPRSILMPIRPSNRLHSEREIFRYDENITFANKELLPCIDAYRDAHARGERYPGMLHLLIC